MSWNAPHALQVLADPQHGFFFWTPLAVLAVIGLVLMMAGRGTNPRHPSCGSLHAPYAGLQVYISGAVESWTVAGAFGQRRFVALTVLLVVGIAALRRRGPRASRTGHDSRAGRALVWWNVALMAEFGTSMMDRQRLELRRNAYDAFVTLPRMAPELVYRYFARRSSFYKPPTPEAQYRCAFSTSPISGSRSSAPTGSRPMETCYALAKRGHEVSLIVRPDTLHRPAIP
jgi:hypothetical protein